MAGIRFVLTNVPAILFVLAILIPSIRREGPPATRYLSWILLLSIGLESVWGGLFHVFAPETAASSIGWQVSPFQFEVGVCDLATGIVAVISFWKGYQFKAAIALFVVFAYTGFAIGHILDALESANYAANNFGLLLVLTVAKVIILSGSLVKARSEEMHRPH